MTETTEPATKPPSSSPKKRVLWFWQSNPNPWDENEKEEWKRYSDFESEYIEEGFQKGQKQVELNDDVVSFKNSIQYKKNDDGRQRPIKRKEVDPKECVREERFCFPERAVKSLQHQADWENDLGQQWHKKYKQIGDDEQYQWPIRELAAEGILAEGRLLKQDFDAQIMADKLRSCKKDEELYECAAVLYSAQSFLYKLVNLSMRDRDMSKVDTLGPFCWLLNKYLVTPKEEPEQVVYRGMTLTNEMIEEYRQALGKRIHWPAFTSTTKDREVAEQFGNSLFIIRLNEFQFFSNRSDISSLSFYPNEQEVLIRNQCLFKVDKMEYDSVEGKYVIHMNEL